MNIYSYTFSPTGTSAKILQSINAGIADSSGPKAEYRDLTRVPAEDRVFQDADLVIVAAPVYGGKISPLIKQRLGSVSGNGAKCILVAVYGNRAFENALVDFAGFMTGRGFVVCGAAAFVGEHSYSTAETPIAQGRPDAQDIADAGTFGKEIAAKALSCELRSIDIESLKDIPSPAGALLAFRDFVMAYQKQQAEAPKVYLPQVDIGRCDDCGACLAACPTAAISSDFHGVDAEKCIKCCACVKTCPQNARTLSTPFAKPLSENFSLRKSPLWIF